MEEGMKAEEKPIHTWQEIERMFGHIARPGERKGKTLVKDEHGAVIMACIRWESSEHEQK